MKFIGSDGWTSLSKRTRIAVGAVLGATLTPAVAVAGGTTAPGFTAGLPIYAIFPESLSLVNQTQTSFRNVNGTDVRANSDVAFFTYFTDWNILGGKAYIVFAPSVLDVNVENGPHSSGIYNTYAGFQVNWELVDGLYAGYRFSGYLPQKGEVALNYGTIEHRAGMTYLKDGWQATANFMYGTPLDRKDGRLAPDYGIFEWSVTRALGKFGLGVVGHAIRDLNSPGPADRQRSAALGGLVSYDFGGAALQVKLTRDIAQKNYGGKQTTLWTNLIVPLWSRENPAPIAAKY